MEFLSKFFNVIILVFGAFFVTTAINAANMDRIVQESTTVTVTKFTDTVRKQGKLTAEVYNAFVQKLDAEDVLFNMDMRYAKQVYNPTGNESSVLTEDCYYTQDLLDGLFSSGERGKVVDGKDDGVVYFSKDDTFTVHVTNRS